MGYERLYSLVDMNIFEAYGYAKILTHEVRWRTWICTWEYTHGQVTTLVENVLDIVNTYCTFCLFNANPHNIYRNLHVLLKVNYNGIYKTLFSKFVRKTWHVTPLQQLACKQAIPLLGSRCVKGLHGPTSTTIIHHPSTRYDHTVGAPWSFATHMTNRTHGVFKQLNLVWFQQLGWWIPLLTMFQIWTLPTLPAKLLHARVRVDRVDSQSALGTTFQPYAQPPRQFSSSGDSLYGFGWTHVQGGKQPYCLELGGSIYSIIYIIYTHNYTIYINIHIIHYTILYYT